MTDDKKKVGQPDRSKINQHEAYEMAVAEEEMHAPAKEIEEAIAKVGVSRKKVAAVVEKEHARFRR